MKKCIALASLISVSTISLASSANAQSLTPPNSQNTPSQSAPAPNPPAQDAAPAAPSAPAPTASGASAKVGDTIYDKAGESLGSVAAVNGDAVVVSMPEGKGSIPITSLANGPKGLMINMAKADVASAIKAAGQPASSSHPRAKEHRGTGS